MRTMLTVEKKNECEEREGSEIFLIFVPNNAIFFFLKKRGKTRTARVRWIEVLGATIVKC